MSHYYKSNKNSLIQFKSPWQKGLLMNFWCDSTVVWIAYCSIGSRNGSTVEVKYMEKYTRSYPQQWLLSGNHFIYRYRRIALTYTYSISILVKTTWDLPDPQIPVWNILFLITFQLFTKAWCLLKPQCVSGLLYQPSENIYFWRYTFLETYCLIWRIWYYTATFTSKGCLCIEMVGLAWLQHLLELCHLSDGGIGCSVLTLL